MLDILARKNDAQDLLVAHFNHGTRPSAAADEAFVEKRCKNYNIKFIAGHGYLGEGVSEDTARHARYDFLYSLAKDGAKIYTAHHLDDLCETVAINLLRGTGWRGLAALNNPQIERPLLSWPKTKILEYAATHQIVFREDPTNSSDNYLRNRLRPAIRSLPLETKQKIYQLQQSQIALAAEIQSLSTPTTSRVTYQTLPDDVAMEILRHTLAENHLSLTHPQLADFLSAIRTYKPGKYFNLPGDKLVKITKTDFLI